MRKLIEQGISTLGQAGHALLIDCRSLKHELVPLPEGVSIVICDTMKRRGLVDSAYNERRQQCQTGVRLLKSHLPGITALRDDRGRTVKSALPSTPVQVLGLNGVPKAGELLHKLSDPPAWQRFDG